jgi:putative ABC transport system permease protein
MRWWSFARRKRDIENKLESEIRFHIDQLTRDKILSGAPPEQARREALLEFGGAEQTKEELRDVHRLPLLETLLRDLVLAVRLIRKSPGFSAAIIVTLALGIGANSAVFSAINAILLRPLPFPDSGELVVLQQSDRTSQSPAFSVAPIRLEDWNRLNKTFHAISGYYTEDISDTTGSIPEKIKQAIVAPRFLQVWGVAPEIGRDFSPVEEHFGGPTAILISHRYWLHRFHGDRNVLHNSVRLEGHAYPIIGVLPTAFQIVQHDIDLWTVGPPDAPYAQSRDATWYNVLGRLKGGISLGQAAANLNAVQAELGRQFPKTDRNLQIEVDSLKASTVAGSGRSLWILFGAVSLLLLIACTNIAALLLSRSAERQREISVRFSLGASRSAVILQLLMECFVLAFVGSLLGLCVASAGAAVLRHFAASLPRAGEISLDGRILSYTLACSCAVTLLCGLIPAVRATSFNLSSRLAQGGRTHISGRHPVQWVLVGTQVALAVILLVGAGLMVRSFQKIGRINPGFDPSHVLTFRISANWGETTNRKTLTHRIDHALDALRSLPGVAAAATSDALPGIPADARIELKLVDGSIDPTKKLTAESRSVSAGYFDTIQIPRLAGQACSISEAHPAVVVNRTFASTYLGNGSSIGQHLKLAADSFNLGAATIIGLVADACEQGLTHAPAPTVYWCASAPTPSPYFLVRTKAEPMPLAETIRTEIHRLEPARSVYGISPLAQHLSDVFEESRLRTGLLSAFAVSAIALACTGLYGSLSYFVTTRRREVGLRLALGAEPGQMVTRVFWRGLTVAAVGCAAGLFLAGLCSRVLAGMLFGVGVFDLPTMLGVPVLVLLVAAMAALVPAIRAAGVEPMEVLREE